MAIFIKVDGIKGSVTAAKHTDWSEVISIGWGAENVRPRASLRAVAAAHQNFMIIKNIDDASVEIFRALNLGTVFREMKIEVLRTGSFGLAKFYSIDFKNIIVRSYSISGSGEELTESISFAYEEYEVQFVKLDSDNNAEHSKSFQGTVGETGQSD